MYISSLYSLSLMYLFHKCCILYYGVLLYFICSYILACIPLFGESSYIIFFTLLPSDKA